MDSFYDIPRRPPVPIVRETLAAVPVVPEISVLCSSNAPKNVFTPYHQWKEQQNVAQNCLYGSNKENNYQVQLQNNSILKKQVRFESPRNQQKPLDIKKFNFLQSTTKTLPEMKPNDSKHAPTFEQIYMANIPNRQLDLSIIDLPKNKCDTQETSVITDAKAAPKTYREFMDLQKTTNKSFSNNPVTDALNSKPRNNSYEPYFKVNEPFHLVSEAIAERSMTAHRDMQLNRCQSTIDKDMYFLHGASQNAHESNLKPNSIQNICSCPNENNNPNANDKPLKLKDDDVSTKDLLKIIAQQGQQIAQQNSQLLLLQQQVSELVSMQKQQKAIEVPHHCQQVIENSNKNIPERCITSTQHELIHESEHFRSTPRKKVPNFSIGLTTSFEVSFRRPQHRNQNDLGPKATKLLDFQPDAPRIQEVTETDSVQADVHSKDNVQKETLVGSSMVFKEPIKVRESCPSPEPSIQIEMNDFDDSDSDDNSSQGEASFYRNLMTQVNKILRKAQIETGQHNMPCSNLNNKTIHKVREATVRHLRKIGVDVDEFSASSFSEETAGKSYNEEDISFAVKQLLMKYLPAEHLAQLASRQPKQCISTPKAAIRNRPEFSFATVQYMKKYNLFAGTQKDFKPKASSESPKILDISKLKQQPKLL